MRYDLQCIQSKYLYHVSANLLNKTRQPITKMEEDLNKKTSKKKHQVNLYLS